MNKGEKDRLPAGSDGLTAEEVAAWLQANPGFLLDNADLVTSLLSASRRGEDNVIDIQSLVVKRLREELVALRESANRIINTTRSNISSQQQTHHAAISLLEAEGLDDLLSVIADELPPVLGLDVCVLCLEGNDTSGPVVSLEDGAAAVMTRGLIEEFMGDHDVILRARAQGDVRLYGGVAGLVRSEAMVRILPEYGAPRGLFALASRKENTFHPHQATDLLLFLTAIVTHCVERWARTES